MHGRLGLGRGLAKRLLPLTLAIGILLSVGVPVTFYCIASYSLQRTATVYAEELAERLGELVFTAPTLWKYQVQKYLQLLQRFVAHKELIRINILDEAGRSISEYNHNTAEAEVWWNRNAPVGSAPIRFNNRQMGTAQLQVSRGSVLRTTLVLLVCSTLVGVGLARLVYRFPVAVVAGMEGQMQTLLEASQRSQAASEARRREAEALALIGRDLMRLAQRNACPYALAILDYQMPEMDGLALARAIKADPALAATRLILLTSFGSRVHSEEARRAGFTADLLKPIRQSQLYDCMVTVMGTAPAPSRARPITRHVVGGEKVQLRARVLIAEDNVVNQKVAARMLEKLGCRVDVVANGRETVEASGRIAYDCIFMDCQMPEMDGYEATAVIRQRDAQTGGHTPIIAMTANALQGDREQCLKAGMDDYVSKPIQAEELAITLRQWIQPRADAGAHPIPTTAAPTVPLEPVV